MRGNRPTRRTVLRQWLALPALPAALALSAASAPGAERRLVPTPACDDREDATPSQTEGPFHKPDSPMRHEFVPAEDADGQVTLVGLVLTPRCRPVANALVDIWHADPDGAYDNDDFRFRGHQFTDPDGRYWVRTLRPGLYGSRTRHYHVKIQPEGGPLLTTQLYFPGEARNGDDWLFDPALVMTMAEVGDGELGRFDFVVDV